MALKLGLMAGYWGASPPDDIVALAQRAEALGYWGYFTAEAYGSDALTPLAWVGAHTKTLKLGTAIAQISARTPASMAMHALTLDHLSKGRFILGLGVSGPQVVEGWYGQPFAMPLARTREYISIVRQVLGREGPVQNDGPHYPVPYPVDAKGSWGLGKPLKSITHPLRADVPIFLGAEGPKNVTMATELCDGWYPLYYSPWRQEVYAEPLANMKPGFEIAYPMKMLITDDIEGGWTKVKQNLALYIGGMGAKDRNFHNELIVRLGFADAAKTIQDHYLAGRRAEAVAAVPDELVDEVALVGPKDRIRQLLAAWQDSPVTTLLVSPKSPAELETMAELVLG
ncbi:MAG: LLM class F420-dependent oxidoreductase [Pseudomonadota bacterium]|nr:LLM class F420-dependent oxidoreductase [Pseudomonadota bacterium]